VSDDGEQSFQGTEPQKVLARRIFLSTAALGAASALLGCHSGRPGPMADAGSPYAAGSRAMPGGMAPAAPGATYGRAPYPQAARPATCTLTEENIEGPYFKPHAPRRSVLADARTEGMPLHLSGRVVGARCAPLAGALLEVWHADHHGAYDAAGFAFRGTVLADAEGCFAIETIVPGRYLNGRQYRPAHVHVKLAAAGHRALTTQLYFEGDPYNAVDPFIRSSLIAPVERSANGMRMRYDFALAGV
jgi:protocatechuate 3,4-dioxygenase beta subunit